MPVLSPGTTRRRGRPGRANRTPGADAEVVENRARDAIRVYRQPHSTFSIDGEEDADAIAQRIDAALLCQDNSRLNDDNEEDDDPNDMYSDVRSR